MRQVEYDLLVGADGANSVVRQELVRSNPSMQGNNYPPECELFEAHNRLFIVVSQKERLC